MSDSPRPPKNSSAPPKAHTCDWPRLRDTGRWAPKGECPRCDWFRDRVTEQTGIA